MDTPLFFVFLFIHLISLIIGFGSVILIDTTGSLWILKKVKLSFVNSVANITEKLIWTGWLGLVLSGIGLITLKGYIDNLTLIKLFFVAMLGVNGLFLHRIKKGMESVKDDEDMPILYRFRMSIASTVSQMGWWGAVIIGFVHRHISHEINFPNNPWLYIIAILLILSSVILIGESVLKKKAQQASQI